jgi:glycoprotein endo-alpha-1,2-mannosidase
MLKRNGSLSLPLAFVALLGAFGCVHRAPPLLPHALPSPTQAVANQVPRQVLAFYYGWYGREPRTGSWIHWAGVDDGARAIANATHFPRLGPYDSHDGKLVEQHCRWAKEAGITGFIVSWWRRGDFQDRGMPLMLDTAHRLGLSVTIYFEQVIPPTAPTPEAATEDLRYVLEHYGRHPAWLRVNGKPVIFVYGRAVGQLKEGWAAVKAAVDQQYGGGALLIGDRISQDAARMFDGIHTYNPTGSTSGKSAEEIRAWARSAFASWIETAGEDRIACVTVLPGYDDSKLGRKPPRPITDRDNGDTYRVMWEEALRANPDWVVICSWNEWHEGSEIEPSVEDGNRELRTTAEFAPRFLRMPPRARRGPGSRQ